MYQLFTVPLFALFLTLLPGTYAPHTYLDPTRVTCANTMPPHQLFPPNRPPMWYSSLQQVCVNTAAVQAATDLISFADEPLGREAFGGERLPQLNCVCSADNKVYCYPGGFSDEALWLSSGLRSWCEGRCRCLALWKVGRRKVPWWRRWMGKARVVPLVRSFGGTSGLGKRDGGGAGEEG